MTALPLLALTLALPLSAVPGVGEPREEAAALLRGGLATSRSEDPAPGRRLALLAQAAGRAAAVLGESRSADVLASQVVDARWQALADEARAASWLERELDRTAADLAFTPLREAELPVGFPAPTPVLEIELKQYPAYRMASAPSGGMGGGFWTLFRHIESHEIAMTAPVEMTYGEGAAPREERMAFLYGSMEIGATGRDGQVEVIDVEPARVVSLGCRGRMTRERIAQAQAELERWVESSGTWEAAGPLRSMGYNSPMVPAARSYFEVQLPVRPKAGADVARAAPAH
jgi:hypothetical protein